MVNSLINLFKKLLPKRGEEKLKTYFKLLFVIVFCILLCECIGWAEPHEPKPPPINKGYNQYGQYGPPGKTNSIPDPLNEGYNQLCAQYGAERVCKFY